MGIPILKLNGQPAFFCLPLRRLYHMGRMVDTSGFSAERFRQVAGTFPRPRGHVEQPFLGFYVTQFERTRSSARHSVFRFKQSF